MPFLCRKTPDELLAESQKSWDILVEEKVKWVSERQKQRPFIRDKTAPTQKEYFTGRNVLVTGGTGFIGKVIIEELLRCVPDIGKIYVLIRSKKGHAAADRIASIFDSDLFDELKAQQPDAVKKVKAIPGDVSEKGLGLSPSDRDLLINEVSVVLHAAASVRFDDPLKKAVLLNVRGTQQIVELSKQMCNISSLIHISTTYCNTDQENTEEKVYPTPFDWRHLIKLAEKTSLADLEAISPKILGFQPNTYTFTKQMCEKIIDDARHDIPVSIVRPSVVTAVQDAPLPGWTDNLNGPPGFHAGISKGILRVVLINPEVYLNYVPVEHSAKVVIASAWLRGTNQRLSEDPSQIDVINVTGEDVCKSTYKDLKLVTTILYRDNPINALRLPRVTYTSSMRYYTYLLFRSHILFGLFMDLILVLTGQKPRLMKIYRKVHIVNSALLYFMMNKFSNSSDNFWKLLSYITEPEFQVYIPYKFLQNSKTVTLYVSRNILKEKEATPAFVTFLTILHYVHRSVLLAIYLWIGWKTSLWVFGKLNIYQLPSSY